MLRCVVRFNIEVRRPSPEKTDRAKLEQSVQKRTPLIFFVWLDAGATQNRIRVDAGRVDLQCGERHKDSGETNIPTGSKTPGADQDVPVPPSSLNPAQYASLQQFREECQSTGLYAIFSSVQQFRADFSLHLNLELNQLRYLWLAAPEQPTQLSATDLDPEALRLIRAAAADDGMMTL